MVNGPFLILVPFRKIIVKRRIFRDIIITAQRKESRYTALILFGVVTACQGFVAYALYVVLSVVFNLALSNVIGLVVCYCLICVFYLFAFYCSMSKKEVEIQGVKILSTFRNSMVWKGRNLLETRTYLAFYVSSFLATGVCCLATAVIFFAYDIMKYKVSTGDQRGTLAVIIIFFFLQLVLIFACLIFFFNEGSISVILLLLTIIYSVCFFFTQQQHSRSTRLRKTRKQRGTR